MLSERELNTSPKNKVKLKDFIDSRSLSRTNVNKGHFLKREVLTKDIWSHYEEVKHKYNSNGCHSMLRFDDLVFLDPIYRTALFNIRVKSIKHIL